MRPNELEHFVAGNHALMLKGSNGNAQRGSP
jgi:hypothetical protein